MKSQNDQGLLRLSTFIADGVKRLQFLLKYGMIVQSEELLLKLIQEAPLVFFQDSSRNQNLIRLTKRDHKSPFIVVINHRWIVDPVVLAKELKWSKAQLQALLTKVMERAIQVDPRCLRVAIASWAGSWEIAATARAMEQYFRPRHPLRSAIQRWCLRAWFADGIDFWFYQDDEEWQRQWLGQVIPKERRSAETILEIEQGFRQNLLITEALIVRLGQLGMSQDEIREDFYVWLKTRGGGKAGARCIGYVACASVFPYRDRRRGELMAGLVEEVMEGVMEGRLWNNPLVVSHLIQGGMLDTGQAVYQAKTLYRLYAIRRLAEGRVGLALELHQMFKGRFGQTGAELDSLIAEAFTLAWNKAEYGIATGLCRAFGEAACLGSGTPTKQRVAQIRNAPKLAEAMGQPVHLDYSLSFTPKL